MPSAYVYAPITGTVSQGPGCNSGHLTCGSGSSPIDIAATGNIYLYVNYPSVKSIRTYVELLCCSSGSGDDYRRSIRVLLFGEYDAAGCYFGSVLYGHVKNPAVSNNTIYNLSSTSKYLGQIVGGTSGSCYTGAHIHMQSSGPAAGPSCSASVWAGSTLIYSWGVCTS